MQIAAGVALTVLITAGSAWAADSAVKCDVRLDVIDKDPNGLNVRSSPSIAPGNVTGVLKLGPTGDYIEVHVTAQSGSWYAIDQAKAYEDSAEGERVLFQGHGFVHASKLGASEMDSQAVVHESPSDGSKIILDLAGAGETPVQSLGCQGRFYKVFVKKITGWSKDICTDERTTCV